MALAGKFGGYTGVINKMARSDAQFAADVGMAETTSSPVGLGRDQSGSVENSGVGLSARERTIVLLIGHGLSNKMIARRLSIAPETVKSHAKRVFLKLTVQSRAQAVYRASMLGLI
jgi:LuxR family maltose regulon positive regulatory protein